MKSGDFQLIQSFSSHGKLCAVYATHISPFFIWPSLFYRTELYTSTTLHTPNTFQWLKKKFSSVGFQPRLYPDREGQRDVKCELCCSSPNSYSDFYSEIYSCRPFPEFFPFSAIGQSTKSLIHTGMAQALCSIRREKGLGEKIDHLLELPRLWRSVQFFIRTL